MTLSTAAANTMNIGQTFVVILLWAEKVAWNGGDTIAKHILSICHEAGLHAFEGSKPVHASGFTCFQRFLTADR